MGKRRISYCVRRYVICSVDVDCYIHQLYNHLGCLGENPYVRMLIDRYSGTCKMCEKPFTVFKWRPGRGEGYRKTEVNEIRISTF
jgi:hypothetical protein